jgi:hypothetical protein
LKRTGPSNRHFCKDEITITCAIWQEEKDLQQVRFWAR